MDEKFKTSVGRVVAEAHKQTATYQLLARSANSVVDDIEELAAMSEKSADVQLFLDEWKRAVPDLERMLHEMALVHAATSRLVKKIGQL